jgi:hypothetical protein
MTKDWKSQKVANITYHYPPSHKFDLNKAERLRTFQDSLIKIFDVKIRPIDFYVAKSFDDYEKAVGFDFMLSMGSQIRSSGNTDVRNCIIYSGGEGEYFPHELVHIYVNPLFPNANGWLLAGISAVYGGSLGRPLSYHYKRTNEYLKLHSEIDLNNFLENFGSIDQRTSPVYVIGGLFSQLALEKAGISELRKFLSLDTRQDENFYKAIETEFGIPKNELNDFIRKEIEKRAHR